MFFLTNIPKNPELLCVGLQLSNVGYCSDLSIHTCYQMTIKLFYLTTSPKPEDVQITVTQKKESRETLTFQKVDAKECLALLLDE